MQRDGHDETNSHYSQFCGSAQKQQSKIWAENLNSNVDKNLSNSKTALKIAFQTEHRVHITSSASVISLLLQCGSTTDINNAAQNKLTFSGYQENKPTSYITSIYTLSIEHVSAKMASHRGSY